MTAAMACASPALAWHSPAAVVLSLSEAKLDVIGPDFPAQIANSEHVRRSQVIPGEACADQDYGYEGADLPLLLPHGSYVLRDVRIRFSHCLSWLEGDIAYTNGANFNAGSLNDQGRLPLKIMTIFYDSGESGCREVKKTRDMDENERVARSRPPGELWRPDGSGPRSMDCMGARHDAEVESRVGTAFVGYPMGFEAEMRHGRDFTLTFEDAFGHNSRLEATRR
jgi:hypothetical protein